jgi:Tol biopolymer transport system component
VDPVTVAGGAGGRATRRVSISLAFAAIATGACGRIAFDPRADDAGATGDATDTSADAAPWCAFGPFGTPTNLGSTVNSNFDDYVPALSGDGLRMVFESNRPGGVGGYDLYESTRPDAQSPFGSPVPIAELNDAGHQGGPWLSVDGLTLYFVDQVGTEERVYVTRRPSVDQPFGPRETVPGLETTRAWGPTLSDDGLEIFYGWFVQNLDVFHATRATPDGAFSAPVRLAELNTASSEGFVDLHGDGLTIYFSSNRSGTEQIYQARRPARGASFEPPALVPELASSSHTAHPELSRDGTTLVFGSQRPGGSGAFDLWMATRTCQ